MDKAIIYTEHQDTYQTHFAYSANAMGIDVEVNKISIQYSRHFKGVETVIYLFGNQLAQMPTILRYFGGMDKDGGEIVKDIITQFTETGECKFQLVFDGK